MQHALLIAISIASLLAASVTDAAPDHTKGRAVKPFTSELKSADYVWHPEVSPAGPVVVFVSLPDQVVYVYRNGVRIGRSTVSTGKPGKSTPTGVFTVLQKKVHHESSIYKGAKMPHMQRLTWTGIALHARRVARQILKTSRRKSFGNSSRSVSCSTRSLAALMLSTEKYQLTAFSSSDSLMGWEIRAILRIPMAQPMPMTPAFTPRSSGRP